MSGVYSWPLAMCVCFECILAAHILRADLRKYICARVCVSLSSGGYFVFVCVYVSNSGLVFCIIVCVRLCACRLRSVYYIRYSTSFAHHIFLGRSIPLTPYKTIIAPLAPLPCMATIITTLPGGTRKTGREADASTLPPSLCPSTPTLCPSIISPRQEVSGMEGWSGRRAK